MNADAVSNGPRPTGENTGHLLGWLTACLLAILLCACGGGGGSGTTAPVPAAITAQPVSVSATAGAAATFSVTASGDGLGYQWQRSIDNAVTWADIAGATAATYTIPAVDVSLNGYQYRAVVTGTVNSVTSSAVTLTVAAAVAAPVVTVPPANQSVVAGANASFSVTATGTSLTYQWQSSVDGTTWVNVNGATSATLSLTAVAVTDSGKQFRAVVSNSAGSVNSASALLTVAAAAAAPAIVTQPVATTVVAPQTATFTVVASGNPAPTYQWQLSTDGGVTFTDIVSATGSSYTTPATATTDSGKQFRVHVVNTAGDVYSAAATLTVTPAPAAPTITTQPSSQSVVAPATATFTVAATGNPSPTYQWQLSTDGGVTFANINGAVSASYTTPVTTAADSGKQFRTVVTNGNGSVTSGAAMLTIVMTALGGFPNGIVLNSAGMLYVAEDVSFSGIQQVDPTSGATVSVAGSTFGGLVDGAGSAARFPAPEGIALDSAGNLYIADYHAVRKMSPSGVVSTIAGSTTRGFQDGVGVAATFRTPSAVAVNASGTIYVGDTGNSAIRVISSGNVVTTLALHGSNGLGIGLGVTGIAIDANGTLYVAAGNIYSVSPTGLVTLFATVSVGAYDLVSDGAGGFYATGGNVILRVSAAGAVTTLAGTGAPGFVDGVGSSAQFKQPLGLTVDASGNLYVADSLNQAIRKVTPSGLVTTIAH